MADTNFRGPVNSMGSLEVDAATASVYPLDGPGSFYQGLALPDIRSAPFSKDGFRPGQQPGFLTSGDVIVLDNIPQARSSTLLGAAQVATALGSTVALATAQVAGVASSCLIAIGVPLIPLGTTVATVANIALDFGFATGTTTANSSTIVVVDSTIFRPGQWLVVGGVANAAGSRSLIAQVISSPSATAIQVSPSPATGLANIPIGQANLWGSTLLPPASSFGPSAPTANAAAAGGALEAGLARVYNPREMLSRNISVQGSAAVSNYSCLVSGWDVWGAPMTEVITSASDTTFQGKKAFKYISSITQGVSQVAGTTLAYGIGDKVGLPIRADYWEELYATWNGVAMANFSGFTAAVVTPATSTTGDIRGTLQLSTSIVTGGLATAMSIVATNGTGRIFASIALPPTPLILGTPINQAPIFGPAQSTATT